ncbi:unnamed protein product [Paramecium sonneborni]|uniref:Uncharacterized protein n=1 Tax=Paramecium sonneborni TaxID=65129 RepID=A0A8S1QBK4_9CILI|nr:unnamed protein product [Paramecium sonneborni]CAD8112191.1 unnamed protein product [Paramecium sonneborni]
MKQICHYTFDEINSLYKMHMVKHMKDQTLQTMKQQPQRSQT